MYEKYNMLKEIFQRFCRKSVIHFSRFRSQQTVQQAAARSADSLNFSNNGEKVENRPKPPLSEGGWARDSVTGEIVRSGKCPPQWRKVGELPQLPLHKGAGVASR